MIWFVFMSQVFLLTWVFLLTKSLDGIKKDIGLVVDIQDDMDKRLERIRRGDIRTKPQLRR